MNSQQPDPDQSLVARVRKLLAKAENTDNPHEAEAFSAKAAALIARHRIDPDQLAASNEPGSELVVQAVHVGRGAYVRARINLIGHVADAHDVNMVFSATPTGHIAWLAGRSEDIDVVEVLYASLHAQVASQMATIKRHTGAATQRERRSFLFGFSARIGQLLRKSRETAVAEAQRAAADGGDALALALRERRDTVDAFAAEQWGTVRSAGAPSAVQSEGFARGEAAADRADVGRAKVAGRRAIGRGSP